MCSDPNHRQLPVTAALFVVLLAACGGGSSPPPPPSETPAGAGSTSLGRSIEALRVPAGANTRASIPRRLRAAKGPVEVWVTLGEPSLAQKKSELRPQAAGRHWKDSDAELKAVLKTHRQLLERQQDSAMSALARMGASELGRVGVAHNAVAVRVDAARLKEIEALPDVTAVRPVRDYQLNLSETVPYVGGAAARAAGYDGAGVRVAVLDSGIDYTHRNLGGPGTVAAYTAAYGSGPADPRNTTRDGLFPTAKVVDGHDFVGEFWPLCPAFDDCRVEDPDPIDFRGHGTHVADIIAGVGPNQGVAPGAKLVAVKVCSSVTGACRGTQVLRGVDFALDPDGDGDPSDAVDVINLSLSEVYGQVEDELSFALNNAVKLGVVVVAAAGDNANRPYIAGAPSIARGVISVAQTHVPSATRIPLVIDSPAAIRGTLPNTFGVDWAPLGSGFRGEVAFVGGGCPALPDFGIPEEPYLANPRGKIALIELGFICGVSDAVDRAARAGAIAVLVDTHVDGEPLTLSDFTGPVPFHSVPTLTLTRADANRIKTNAPVRVTVAAVPGALLVGGVVVTSSRGPASDSTIKPEIAAPGALVSALAGSGGGEAVFGGTSGATAMVAGAAAVLRAAFPDRTPAQIKAMLMNSADPQVYNDAAAMPRVLAPITRIGAGELRVDRALALHAVAYDRKARSAALSFGFAEVERFASLKREMRIDNFSRHARTYTLASSYRYPDDAASGATSIELPSMVTVPAGGSAEIDVRMKVIGKRLPAWGLNGGSLGGRGDLLEGNEVDGYVTLASAGETLSVPFQALLRKSAALEVDDRETRAGKDIKVTNEGVNPGAFDVFALTGTSERFNKSQLARPGDGFAAIDLRAVGVRTLDSGLLQFAVSRWDRRAHSNWPGTLGIDIDVDNDGIADYFVSNGAPGAGRAESGQTQVIVSNAATGEFHARFFLDADLQSASAIFTVPMADVGLTLGKPFRFSVFGCDFYFGFQCSDAIEGMTYTPGQPRYAIRGGVMDGALEPRQSMRLKSVAVPGGAAASPSQTGFLLLYRQNAEDEIDTVAIKN